MKIFVYYGRCPPANDGGAYYTKELVYNMALLGHEVYWLTEHKRNSEIEFIHENVRIFPVIRSWGLDFRKDKNFKKIKAIFKTLKFDKSIIIHPTTLGDRDIYYLAPWFISHDLNNFNLIWFKPFPARPKLLEFICSTVLALKASSIFTHEIEISNISKMIPILNKKVVWAPLGSTIRENNKQPLTIIHLKKKYNIDSNTIVLGFLGYCYKSKGVDILYEVLNKLIKLKMNQKIKLLMIGGRNFVDFNQFEIELYEFAKKNNLLDSIIYTGTLNESEIQQYFYLIDIYILPFRKFFTGRTSLVPAINYGLPTVMTGNNNPVGLLEHGVHACVCKPNSVNDLFEAIMYMIENPNIRTLYSSNITSLRHHYTWGNVINNFFLN